MLKKNPGNFKGFSSQKILLLEDITNDRKTYRRFVVLNPKLLSAFLNTGATNKTLQSPGELNSFKHMLKKSAKM